MKIKPALIVFTPFVLFLIAIGIFSPEIFTEILSWPVCAGLAVVIGIFCGNLMRRFD